MIEFTGVITGEAEKHHRKKERRFGRNLLWLSMILVSPLAVTMCVLMHWWGMIIIYGALFCAVPLLCCIPQSKKEKQNVTPKTIYIIDDYITAVCGTFEVYKNIKSEDLLSKVNHDDTFPAYTFEANPNELSKRLEAFVNYNKDSNSQMELNSPEGTLFYMQLSNFKFIRKTEGGFVTWDANTDMVKFRYFLSGYDEKELHGNIQLTH